MSGGTRTSGASNGSGFARDVPRGVQAIVSLARKHLAAPLPGERGRMRRVASTMKQLQEEAGHDAFSTTFRQVTAAEALGLMRRSGATSARQVYVDASPSDVAVAELLANMQGDGACLFCGAQTTGRGDRTTSSGRWCASCQPAFRRDRVWKQTAVNLLHDGKTLPSIAAAVSQPLYPLAGESPLSGVVATLLAEAPDLVPDAYREGLRVHLGAEHAQLSSVLTSRSRQRRHRRQDLLP